jgi:o-succinylbenzoate synthase
MELSVERVSLAFRAPVQTAFGVLERRELLAVRLRDLTGVVGLGEAAPLEPYDGVSLDAVEAQVLDCREVFAEAEGREREEVADACRRRCPLPQAMAALDMALWDLEGRRRGVSVAALLSDAPAKRVEVNATVTARDRAGAAAQAAEAVAEGFRCVKVKVGAEDDAGRLAAVRAAVGPDVALRVDANGAWSVDEAVAALRALAPVGVELCEEPVHGVEALRAVREAARELGVAVAMDETAREPGAVESGVADSVCLKVAAQGGISGVMAAAGAARAAGTEPYLASTFDGPVGIAAAVHAAAALGSLPPCGLATLRLFEDADEPLPVRRGAIAVPERPGLGLPSH